jgi:beta-fructofuranosidase
MVIGTRIENVGGLVLLYRSQDLIHWEYLHPLLVGDLGRADPFWTGTMWECPNLLDLGDKRALLFSIQATAVDHLYVVYHTGTYETQRFTSETQGILVHGGCFYAPQAMRLDDGRYVLWGWLKEGRSQRISEWAGWAGVMSLPLAVSLQPDGKLALEPVPELQVLRGQHWHFEGLELGLDSAGLLDGVQGDNLEIVAEFESDGAAEFGLRLRCSPDGQEQTRIVYRPAPRQVVLERDASSVSPDVERGECMAPVESAAGESLRLHIFLDRSVLEVFVNGGRTCLASRIYPLRPDSLGVGLFARCGNVKLKSMDIYRMRTIWG